MDILLYENTCPDTSVILRDIDINTHIDIDPTNNTKSHILAHDKLMHTDTLNHIINNKYADHDASAIIIINHTLDKNADSTTTFADRCNSFQIITAYANGYKPLYNNIISDIRTDKFMDALLNGMHVTELNHMWYHDNFNDIINKYMKLHPTTMSSLLGNLRTLKTYKCANAISSMCKSITELETYDGTTTCKPFKKTLKILHANSYIIRECKMSDNGLRTCKNIEVLHAMANNRISTCDPFSKTLRELCVSTHDDCICSIDNRGIRLCKNIERLYAWDNDRITTCEPFAKSLKVLSAGESCCISDDGLRHCFGIEYLDASRNENITTCEPFARTLRKLEVRGSCGITNDALRVCTQIEMLNVDYNDKITTCDPFARSLIVLSARCDETERCGITDDGLRLCKNIRYLFADDNDKITSCKPFAANLRMLSARGSCGIRDEERKLCPNITNMYTYGNPKIVACSNMTHERMFEVRMQFFWLCRYECC